MTREWLMLAAGDAQFISHVLENLMAAGLPPMDRELVRMARPRLTVCSPEGEIVPLAGKRIESGEPPDGTNPAANGST